MTTIESAATTIRASGVEFEVDEVQLAAVSFLARYSGRTLEAYRHDLRGFFQWATDHGVAVLEASRAVGPSLSATEQIASHWCSSTIRTARSRISRGYGLPLVGLAPSSQRLKRPAAGTRKANASDPGPLDALHRKGLRTVLPPSVTK
jgi:hypothetical protein